MHSIYLSKMTAVTDLIDTTTTTSNLKDTDEKQGQQKISREKVKKYHHPLHLYLDIQIDRSLSLKEAQHDRQF